jgi:hypothetical protein
VKSKVVGAICIALVASIVALVAIMGGLRQQAFVLGETDQIVDDWPGRVFWLDNDTTVFVGEFERPGQGGFGYDIDRAKLYLWRLGRQPRAYATDRWPRLSGSGGSYICAANGRIGYALEPRRAEMGPLPARWRAPSRTLSTSQEITLAWKQKIAEGAPGQEIERERVMLRATADGEIRYPINQDEAPLVHTNLRDCEDYSDDRKNGRIWVRSYDQQYYLDFRGGETLKSGYVERFLLEGADGSNPKVFSGPFDHLREYCVGAPSWESSFVLYDCAHGMTDESRAERALTIYRVNAPSGKLIETRVDNTEALWGIDVARYKNGYVIASTAAASPNWRKYQGIYIVSDQTSDIQKPKLLVRGAFKEPAVSPDGCRVAVLRSHRTPNKFRSLSNLVVIDLCRTQER